MTFLVLAGDGINCERESARALESAGLKPRIVHINDLCSSPEILKSAQGMIIPGGFSFGDELGAGQLLALKIRHELSEEFFRFVAGGRPVLGVCNGFQVLAKLGLLPDMDGKRTLALAPNENGRFVDAWERLQVNRESSCPWLLNVPEKIDLPIRHGEGRVVLPPQELEELDRAGRIVFKYERNPNGSAGSAAGLCDPSGLILGMMPHPEAALFRGTDRHCRSDWRSPGDGLALFTSIARYLEES